MATITKNNGELVSQAYLRRRVSSALSQWRRLYSLANRRAVIAATIENEAWMEWHAGQTVGSIIRAVGREL